MRRECAAVALLCAVLTAANVNAQDPIQNTSSATSEPTSSSHPIRIDENIQSAKLIHRVVPVYPDAAKRDHIEGKVVLHAAIANDGTVANLDVVSGPPQLAGAAAEAVKQWKYETTVVAGQPVEIDTTISVVFVLETPPAQIASVSLDPQLRADILHLVEVTHAVEQAQMAIRLDFDSMRERLLAAIPETPNREAILSAYRERLVALPESPQFMDGMVAVYARYFSDEDVKALAQFYDTAAGQHFNEHAGELARDLMTLGQQVAAQSMTRTFAEVCHEYPELEGRAKFCATQTDAGAQLTVKPQ
jgi:TonB family protein